MRLPRPRDLGTQQVLWDWVDDITLDSLLSTRTYIGDFFEEATVQLYEEIGAKRLITDGSADVCPDIQTNDGWMEVKSLGRGSNVIIYEHSLDRYKRLQRLHPDKRIYFVFWRHRFQFKFASRLNEMYDKLSMSIESVLVVSLADICKATGSILPLPLRVRSEGEHQHVSAWRLPKLVTDPWWAGQSRMAHDVSVYDVAIPVLTVLDAVLGQEVQ